MEKKHYILPQIKTVDLKDSLLYGIPTTSDEDSLVKQGSLDFDSED